jgi:transposase
MVRLRWHHELTIEYVVRRTAEGTSTREVVRCLKRYVAREVYHTTLLARRPTRVDDDRRIVSDIMQALGTRLMVVWNQ